MGPVCSTVKVVISTCKPLLDTSPIRDDGYNSINAASDCPSSVLTVSLRCRICLDTNTDSELISPCMCKGTMGVIHKRCLEEWLTVAQSGQCELCGFQFRVTRIKPSCWQWLRRGGGEGEQRQRHICSDVVCLLVMLPLLFLTGWLTVHTGQMNGKRGFNWEIFALTVLFLLLSTVFIVWLLLAAQFHYRTFIYWRERHFRMMVIPPPQSASGSANSRFAVTSASGHATSLNMADIPLQQRRQMLVFDNAAFLPPLSSGSAGVADDDRNHPIAAQQTQRLSPVFSLMRSRPIERHVSAEQPPHNHDSSSSVDTRVWSASAPATSASMSGERSSFNHSWLTPIPLRVGLVQDALSIEERHALMLSMGRLRLGGLDGDSTSGLSRWDEQRSGVRIGDRA